MCDLDDPTARTFAPRSFIARLAARAYMGRTIAIERLLAGSRPDEACVGAQVLGGRRAQFHQTRLAEHLSPFDPTYQIYRDRIGDTLTQKGLPAAGADGLMYRELVRQATTLAFADAFLSICLLMLCMLPLVLLMQRAPAAAGGPGAAAH